MLEGGGQWLISQVSMVVSPSPNARWRWFPWYLGTIRKEDVKFSIDLKEANFQILSIMPLHNLEGEGLPVQGSLLLYFFSSTGLHQSIVSGVRVGSQERYLASSQLGRLACRSRMGSSLTGTLWVPTLALQGHGNCHQYWGVKHQAYQQGLAFLNADGQQPREGISDALSDNRILGCGGHIASNSSHVAFFGRVILRGRAKMQSFKWHPKLHWLTTMNDFALPVVSSEEYWLCIRMWLQEERWASGVHLLVPFLYPLLTNASQTDWEEGGGGEHIYRI